MLPTSSALSTLGLGCSRIGSFNNPASLADSIRLIECAIELGVTAIDTSNIYGQGDSERAIGRAVMGRRDRVFVMTKLGRGFSTKMRLLRPFKPLVKPLLSGRGARAAMVARRSDHVAPEFERTGYAATLEASLRRLRTDHVDALFLHSPPLDVLSDPAVAAQLCALQTSGKAQTVGVSCDTVETLAAALAMEGVGIVQLPYDLVVAPGAAASLDVAAARNILVVAREVISAQPMRTPADAICSSVGNPRVTCTLVGTTSEAHLAAAVAAAAS